MQISHPCKPNKTHREDPLLLQETQSYMVEKRAEWIK